MSVASKTKDQTIIDEDEDRLPLFDDDDFDEEQAPTTEDLWREVSHELQQTIELAHREIDRHWPHIPQGKLMHRIRRLKESMDGGGF